MNCAVTMSKDKALLAFREYVNGQRRKEETDYEYFTVKLIEVETDDDGIVVSETVLERTKLYEQEWWIELMEERNKRFLAEEDQ